MAHHVDRMAKDLIRLPVRKALSPPVTVPVAFVHGMLSGARDRGWPCQGLPGQAGIAPELLRQPGARVTGDQYAALFRLLVDRFDDEGLGFFSRRLKRGSLALIARSALDAGTLEAAMRRVARTFNLLQDDVVSQPETDGASAGFTLSRADPGAAHPIFLHELLLRVHWRLLAWLVGGRLAMERVDFAFERPSHADDYGKVFPAQLAFAQPRSAFWFDAAQLTAPVRCDEAALRTFLADAHTHVILPRRSDTGISTRVRGHLQQTQPAWPDLEGVAALLHMSASTLQRRLARESTSFQALKDELRRDTAIVRLNTSAVSLDTLAGDLGFADSTAFQRAFKGWTGSPPGSYRRG